MIDPDGGRTRSARAGRAGRRGLHRAPMASATIGTIRGIPGGSHAGDYGESLLNPHSRPGIGVHVQQPYDLALPPTGAGGCCTRYSGRLGGEAARP